MHLTSFLYWFQCPKGTCAKVMLTHHYHHQCHSRQEQVCLWQWPQMDKARQQTNFLWKKVIIVALPSCYQFLWTIFRESYETFGPIQWLYCFVFGIGSRVETHSWHSTTLLLILVLYYRFPALAFPHWSILTIGLADIILNKLFIGCYEY